MRQPNDILPALFRARWWFACAIAVGLFVWNFSMFYIPGKGFTYLITLGDKWQDRFLPELKRMDVHLFKDSWGYDGTNYSQIAIHPQLRDPELAVAVDNVSYRARRILFCWTAWLAGGGVPERTIQAFAVQNAVAWLLLAVLLFRWLPAVSFQNFFRWFAILFSFGMCFSVARSLVDGPSLLLIACGIALAEANRPWLSAIVLGISGLGKETNLGAVVAIDLPDRFTPKDWIPVVLRGLVVVLPLVLWCAYLVSLFGTQYSTGVNNFGLPFAAYFANWRDVFAQLSEKHSPVGFPNLLVMISLTVQFAFFAARPRWRDRWWRLGATMALLMALLGPAVWEGYPSASARVLLPMLLAFNLSVPRGWKWIVVLVLGNISLFAAQPLLIPPAKTDSQITGPAALIKEPESGRYVKVEFGAGWYDMERSRMENWRWSSGSAGMAFVNPQDFPVVAEVTFDLRSREPRDARLESNGKVLWEGEITGHKRILSFEIELPPGETHWSLTTTVPPNVAGASDQRMIAFIMRDFRMKVLRRVDAPPRG